MSELKICRICLRTEAKVYNYEQFQLKSYYEEVLALKVSETDELPHYFCFECATLLHKFHKFKEKCYSGQKVLKDMLRKGPAGIIELSKFSSKMTPQESEVENSLLETDLNITELPVLNHEFNSTDPVEIDSFFINNLDVVLEDEKIESAPMSIICNETPNKLHSFQEQNVETKTDLPKTNETQDNPLPIVICDLPNENQNLLESDLEYEELDANLSVNLEGLNDNDSSSMPFGDLPSISQVFDESNIEFIENNLDLSASNDIDVNFNSNLPDTSQEPIIEYIIETNPENNNENNNVEGVEIQSTNNNPDSVNESPNFAGRFTSNLNSEEIITELTHNNAEELLTNKSETVLSCPPDSLFETNLLRTDDLAQPDDSSQPDDLVLNDDLNQTDNLVQNHDSFKSQNENHKVKITSKNQVAPNIHSVLPTTSQEYFETVPEPVAENIEDKDLLNQLQVEQAHGVGKEKKLRIRRKYPFRKHVKPSPCHKKCGNECSVRLTDVDRLIIHERYWEMEKKEQQEWLLSCIRPKRIRRRQGSTLMKNITYEYYITHGDKDTKVCQQFLMKTLDISQMRFRYAISKFTTNVESDLSDSE